MSILKSIYKKTASYGLQNLEYCDSQWIVGLQLTIILIID